MVQKAHSLRPKPSVGASQEKLRQFVCCSITLRR